MSFEIDHLFIRSAVGAPQANLLTDFGLREGEPNIHPGQGTANRRFFFNNFMLEFLWIHDEQEACSELTRPTRLAERLDIGNTTTSPFGIALRPVVQDDAELPFKGWNYQPSYLPKQFGVLVGDNVGRLDEPFLFYLSSAQKLSLVNDREIRSHPCGFRDLTSMVISGPQRFPQSEALVSATKTEGLELREASSFSVCLAFDGAAHGRTKSFMPMLPLIFQW